MTDPGEMTDEEALARIGRGDQAAFAWIIETYRARVFQLVRWFLDRDESAEDVAQEVFLQVHRSAARYSGRSSGKTWLYGLALNVCRNHRRALARSRSWGGGVPIDTVADIAGTTLDPLERLERQERHALVRRALAALPPAQRVALHLRDWEGLSYREIAGILEVPVGTVRSRLHNARSTLADRLEGLLRG